MGADVEAVCAGLERVLRRFKYGLHTIRVIEELKRIRGFLENESEFFDEKLENRMNAGDKFRKETDRDDALALLALDNVRRFQKKRELGFCKNPQASLPVPVAQATRRSQCS